MVQEFVDIAGIIVPHDSLTIDRAVALANLAASNRLPYVRLIECRRQSSQADIRPIDTVVLDLTVERPQAPVNDIRHMERIAIVFSEADRHPPEVQAVRASFPWVPHLNLRHEELPRSLCLYDRSWSEMSPRWTPADFLERIRYWLAATARGELHQEDQPLEPLLLHNGLRIVLPQSIYADLMTEVPSKLEVYLASDVPGCRTLIATNTKKEPSQKCGLKFVATVFRGEPRAHGLIRRSPRNLKELDTFLSQSGIQFMELLRSRLLAFEAVLREERLILVMVLPVVRSSGREIEDWNVWAFATEGTIKQVGAAIGIWDIHNGDVAQILFGPDVSRNGENARIDVLSPYSDFSPTTAALANGLMPDCPNVLALGAGALGSQIINTMARTGFGQ